MNEHYDDVALIFEPSVKKEGAKLAPCVLREDELCAEVQNMLAQPELGAT